MAIPRTNAVTFGPFRLDAGTESVWRDAEEIRLRPKTFAILRYLADRPHRLVTKEELLEAIWPDVAVGDAAVAVCVGEIRKSLGDEARTPRFIETVHEYLTTALTMFREMDMRFWLEKAEAEMRATG